MIWEIIHKSDEIFVRRKEITRHREIFQAYGIAREKTADMKNILFKSRWHIKCSGAGEKKLGLWPTVIL